jgi:hypothetical protein
MRRQLVCPLAHTCLAAAAYCHTSTYKVLLSVATSNKKAMYAACLKAKKIAVGEWLMEKRIPQSSLQSHSLTSLVTIT